MAKVSEIYGSMVFNEHTMQERLPSATYKSLIKTMKEGKPLEIEVANVVAHAMKEWAIEKGATHFTHWFQPLTGITSEKHDSFLDPCSDGRAIMSFSGKELIQGEPDASSFPSGGLRATFEARGYTAWDPTSYAFIKDEVLCIPTAFCSYTGEALDKKTPLLRSMSAVEEQANRVLALFGEPRQRIVPTLGAEQEYFLVSEKAYAKRQDLIMTGRTLFGYAPCKGQELDEHYFGAIRPTVNEFMKELDNELWALGVPARTKHNEVAPAQHELAPIFTNVNRGVDENLLTMEKMRLLASHHGLVCLQHEKPFEGINGSGKHNNWSLSAGKKNLFDPGESPMDNLRFLVFLAGVIQAVDDYQELLRMSVASAGNDHRLGADEAPPAIISIFLGDELDAIVDALIDDHEYTNAEKVAMDLGVAVLPNFLKDNTDRNRTSPFAFTGNKFEFRMPGSAASISSANIALNTAVAEELRQFADELEAAEDFKTTLQALIKRVVREHKRVIFNGNGYDPAWVEEAERRGLHNLRSTPEALPHMLDEPNVELYSRHKVFSYAELRSRQEIRQEEYCKLVTIEGKTALAMARREILPAVSGFASRLSGQALTMMAAMPDCSAQFELGTARSLVQLSDAANSLAGQLENELVHAEQIHSPYERSVFLHDHVLPVMGALRAACDDMETITAEDCWPFPTYGELLFGVK